MINNKKFKIILCSLASLGIAFSATNFYGVSSLNIEGKKKAKTELQKKSEELRKNLMEAQKSISEETKNKEDIDSKIKDLQEKTGVAVIFITHDLGVVANMADRVAVMYAGKIIEYGTYDDIFYYPKHPYTWGLLG